MLTVGESIVSRRMALQRVVAPSFSSQQPVGREVTPMVFLNSNTKWSDPPKIQDCSSMELLPQKWHISGEPLLSGDVQRVVALPALSLIAQMGEEVLLCVCVTVHFLQQLDILTYKTRFADISRPPWSPVPPPDLMNAQG